MDFLAGKLLIAVPELPDSNFFRSVVFLIDHSEEGAMGVILNRPSNLTLQELWHKLDSATHVERADFVYVGGPVKGPILALHDSYSITDNEVMDGLYMTMSSERLDELVVQDEVQLKAFTGYSGWGPGQLEMEMECGGWLVTAAKFDDVFAAPDMLWKNICERVGQSIMFPGVFKNRQLGDSSLN